MRPGHLNVFDGLRITTEHMNYLQGSFHSALQDLREIVGLGTVHEGFDVVVQANAVVVGPGLAFDYQKNRIASDQPIIVELTFAQGENRKYVCIKYDQIEDGEVDGRFTLVWDSCAVVLQSTLPDPSDNLLAIARIDRVGGNGVVEVSKILPAGENGKDVVAAPIPEKPVESTPEPPFPAPAQAIRLAAQQGVARLKSESERDLRSALPENPTDTSVPGSRSTNLAEAVVSLDFEPLSLICHTILTATTRGKSDGSEATPYSCSITAQGEVTYGKGVVSQFGVVMGYGAKSMSAGQSYQSSKFIEDGIACLPIRLILDSEDDKAVRYYAGPRPLEILVKTGESGGNGFIISCSLNLREAIAEEEIKRIQDQGYVFEWEALVAWKALGESRG
ncbi:MAG TPA: hypothetical protein VIG25_17310 [Pyrinomonadaceae bacterium]|jgi:hypothetical protein